jgi:hypothetical protein
MKIYFSYPLHTFKDMIHEREREREKEGGRERKGRKILPGN